MVVEVRKATGFGADQIARIVNKGLSMEDDGLRITDTTCYNIMVRYGLVEAERRMTKEYRSFEWSRPDELVQADLTSFNGYPILTMEDDNSRMGWAIRLQDQKDDSVVEAMNELHPDKFKNLLTDNGSQFSRKNSTMRTYCEWNISGKHIWTSDHHPQTMGKLSAFQKGMKRFLRHRLGRSRDGAAIDENARAYLDWYNNGKVVSTTKCTPRQRYSGHMAEEDDGWYSRLVVSLKLEAVLPLCCTDGG